MPDLHNTANPEIQNPFKPDEKIRLSELMGIIDEKYEAFVAADAASEHGTNPTGDLNRLLNQLTAAFTNETDKAIFTAEAIWRYIGEQDDIEISFAPGM
ncbi:hypothetical protein ACM7NO_25495 [Pseudomonas aeruginosa]